MKVQEISSNTDIACRVNKENEVKRGKSEEQQNKSKAKHSRKRKRFSLENF